MAAIWPGWTPDVERSFKEVLFRFLEEVHCTKAALYMVAPDSSFALACQYGFSRRERPPATHGAVDPLARRVAALGANPMAVNHPADLPEAAPYLRASASTRMLLAPLVSGGRTLGFVDARDKGGRRPFETGDLRQAGLIAAALAQLARSHGIPGGAPETDVEDAAPSPEPPPWQDPGGDRLPPRLDAAGVEELQLELVEAVAREGVYAAAASAVDGDVATTVVCAGVGAGEVDTVALTRHQAEALAAAGVRSPHPASWRLKLHRLPVVAEPLAPTVIATAVPRHAPQSALVLSVIGAEGSAPPAGVLDRLRRAVDVHGERAALRFERRALARRLLQPGERSYADLLAHSLAVSRLCWLLATELGLDREAAEEAALAGLLHDVGMRELEYDRLYRHPSPSPEDGLVYRQHVVVGEKILHDTGLDAVAQAVRHHHERWDGKGYPDRLSASAIPPLARLVHVAEVFDVLTSASSYRPPVSTERALQTMKTAGGQQFDPDLVLLLAKVVA